MFKDYPGHIWVARKDSPMVIGITDGECYVASDVPAMLSYTRNVYYIDNLEMADLGNGEVHFYNLDGDEVKKELTEITWDAEAAEKGGFEHFMMKEIHEQPKAIRDTFNSVVKDGRIDLSSVGLTDDIIKDISQVIIVACGSAYHTGVVDQYVMEEFARIPVRVELASEFRYRNPILNPNDLVVIVSQSGETADSLAALREAKAQGIRTLGIVNVVGSSIAREADNVFYTLAGPEIAVASTKAFTAQIMCMYLLALKAGNVRGLLVGAEYEKALAELDAIPAKVEEILKSQENIQKIASKQFNKEKIFYIGRQFDNAISMECALKLKEVSYMHSESFAAGELKHGPIALVDPSTLVIAVATQRGLFDKIKSNIVEVKSRKAVTMVITQDKTGYFADVADYLSIPEVDDAFAALLAVIPAQLLAYYCAIFRGNDPDKPRNLAKSVTVE